MKRSITKDDPEWNIFRDLYHYYEKYGTPEDKDDYWDALVDDGNRFVEDHGNHVLAEDLVKAVMNTFNRMMTRG